MRISFPSLLLAAVVLAVAALASHPAAAESRVVNVPFSFIANGKACPAGAYAVSSDRYRGAIRLAGPNQTFTWLLVPNDAAIPHSRVVLTFDVSGQNHLLRTVQYGPMTTPQIDKNLRESIPAARQIAIGQ